MPELDYSKWDNIELSDDEDDPVPRVDIEREDWIKMRHRERVEREEKEEKERAELKKEIETTQQRIKEIEQSLKKTSIKCDDVSHDELKDVEVLEAELKELKQSNVSKQKTLDRMEKNKSLNMDNICKVVDEKTIINNKPEPKVSSKGFALADGEEEIPEKKYSINDEIQEKVKQVKEMMNSKKGKKKKKKAPKPSPYAQFVSDHFDILEKWSSMHDIVECQEFLLQHVDTLLNKHAADWLTQSALNDEMNGLRDQMRLTARQGQVLGNIAEYAKQADRHPGSMIVPFFNRMKREPDFIKGFLEDTEEFIQKIIDRAKVKKQEHEDDVNRMAMYS